MFVHLVPSSPANISAYLDQRASAMYLFHCQLHTFMKLPHKLIMFPILVMQQLNAEIIDLISHPL
jgi:hypothetical protein